MCWEKITCVCMRAMRERILHIETEPIGPLGEH